MGSARHLRLSTSEISDVTASMPSLGYFALQRRVAPPRKAYSLTSSAFIAFGALYTFSLFKPVFRGSHKSPRTKNHLLGRIHKYTSLISQEIHISPVYYKRKQTGHARKKGE